ncbi:MAG: flagellar hook-length control protein FliK [Rhodomicrobium sp.]
MVQTPHVSYKPGLTPLPPAAGKVSKKQTVDDGTFASLLDAQSANVAEAVPNHTADAARAVQIAGAALQGRPASAGQQAQPAADGSSGKPPSAPDVAQAIGSPPFKGEYSPFPSGDLAFFPPAYRAKGNPATASTKQNAQPAKDANAPVASANTKNDKSENSPETVTPAPQINASVDASPAAVLAEQLQIAPKAQAPAGVKSAGGAPVGHAQVASANTKNDKSENPPETVAPAPQINASVDASPAAVLAEQVQIAPKAPAPAGVKSAGGAPVGQAQVAASPTPPPLDLVQGMGKMPALPEGAPTPGAAAQEIASSPGASAKPNVESAAPGLTVTDVQTHFTPEMQTAKTQALASASSGTEPSPPADRGASEAASNAAPGAGPGSHRDSSGGETPEPAPADKQAAQSSEVKAAPAVASSGQTAPSSAPSPVQQVFNAIQSAMPAAAEGEPPAAAGGASAPASYQPLKTITIAFQPDGLGTVAIQLSLKDSQLGVKLETSETSTAQILRQHGADLTELLRAAGYDVGSIAVQAASQQPAPADTPAQAPAGGQNASNMSDTGGSGTGGSSTGTDGEARRQPSNRNEQRESGYGGPETANRDSSLYV